VSTSNNSNAIALRGLAVAMLILGLCIGGFAIVSNGGHVRTPAFIDDITAMLSSPARSAPVKKARDTSASQTQIADPGARRGLPAGAAPEGPATGSAAPRGGSAPRNAAEALQEVLHQYRNDPKHTATVTISSTGRIVQSAPGPLTAHDGLPIDAINGSTEMQGAAGGATRAP